MSFNVAGNATRIPTLVQELQHLPGRRRQLIALTASELMAAEARARAAKARSEQASIANPSISAKVRPT